jgi:hypothetical protein
VASLSKTAATFRVFGDDLEPDEITKLLGKKPDRAERKGEERLTPNGKKLIARTGSWRIKVERRAPGDLDGQIAELLEGMTDDLSAWQQVTSRFQVDIFCGLFLEGTNEGLPISAASTALLGSRGISLDFDIYYDGND